MNRITELFDKKKSNILSIYFTAGYPKLNDTAKICAALQEAGVDLVEIGMPFSDPVADGATIQQSSRAALQNGMSLDILFSQLLAIRKTCTLPLILMGYLNPVLQFGVERFAERCKELSIDGVIIPDLPLELYLRDYKDIFEKRNLLNIFLITPQTAEERMRYIDQVSSGFIYAVSSAAVTGGSIDMQSRSKYLERLKNMKLGAPIMVGFGISGKRDFEEVCKYAAGGIIGSAFIRKIEQSIDLTEEVKEFISQFKL